MSLSEEKPDWLTNPLPIINEAFEQCVKSGEDWGKKISNILNEDVKKSEIIKQIPWLNETPLHKLSTNQIVRFRGMIQDIFEQEFYMDTYEIKKSDGTTCLKPGRYMDVASCNPDEEINIYSKNCQTSDRSSYYCISVPGENEWVKEIYFGENPDCSKVVSSNNRENTKRSLEDVTDVELKPMEIEDKSLTNGMTKSMDGKRLKENNKKEESHKAPNNDLNFPFPNMKGIGCIIKVYDEESTLKLNDLVEVIGILSVDPTMTFDASEQNDQQTGFVEEIEAHSPPPSLVPRLHVLSYLVKDHYNPLLPSKLSEWNRPDSSQAVNMRELLGSILDIALLGDELATEYLVCHLVSSVYMRQGIVALGNFSLNLTGITEELQQKGYPKLLYGLLQSLTTHSHYLSMSLDNMNKLTFIPKKDYDKNRLNSGILQLPPHLHLVLDETCLSPGQLDTNGMKNLTSLGNLVNWQKVDYDFQFHTIEQHSNAPTLILSEGKAIISTNYQVKLDPKHTDVSLAFNKVSSMLDDPKVLNDLRSHLTYTKLASYALPEDMQKKVQNDFVESRKHENGMTAEDLHSLLTLARLIAQGLGKNELTDEVWRSAKMLETERKGRLRKSS